MNNVKGSKWKCGKECIPSLGEDVLVFDGMNYFIGRVKNNIWKVDSAWSGYEPENIYWMELPSPPE